MAFLILLLLILLLEHLHGIAEYELLHTTQILITVIIVEHYEHGIQQQLIGLYPQQHHQIGYLNSLHDLQI